MVIWKGFWTAQVGAVSKAAAMAGEMAAAMDFGEDEMLADCSEKLLVG